MHVLQHKKNICKLKLKNGSWGRKGLSEATACCAGFRLMESSFFPVQMRALLCSHYTGPGHLPDLTAANYPHFPTARLQPREELPPPHTVGSQSALSEGGCAHLLFWAMQAPSSAALHCLRSASCPLFTHSLSKGGNLSLQGISSSSSPSLEINTHVCAQSPGRSPRSHSKTLTIPGSSLLAVAHPNSASSTCSGPGQHCHI